MAWTAVWLRLQPFCLYCSADIRALRVVVLASGSNTTGVLWDDAQQSPYFNYRAADGQIHQVSCVHFMLVVPLWAQGPLCAQA